MFQSGAVFNIIKDGQVIGSEATDRSGKITVPNVTEGLYAFVEVSAPAGYARLLDPVIAHVDQKTVNGGGTITVTASNKKLPDLQILKLDEQTKEPVANTTFEVKGIHYGYHQDNILPPVRMQHGYLQAGEPHCHLKNDKGIPRACYMTFIKPDTEWIYAGICFEGEDENRVPVKTLNDKFIHLMGGIV